MASSSSSPTEIKVKIAECNKREVANLEDLRSQKGRREIAAKQYKTLMMGAFGVTEDEVEADLKKFRSYKSCTSSQIDKLIKAKPGLAYAKAHRRIHSLGEKKKQLQLERVGLEEALGMAIAAAGGTTGSEGKGGEGGSERSGEMSSIQAMLATILIKVSKMEVRLEALESRVASNSAVKAIHISTRMHSSAVLRSEIKKFGLPTLIQQAGGFAALILDAGGFQAFAARVGGFKALLKTVGGFEALLKILGGYEALCRGAGGFEALCRGAGGFEALLKTLGGFEALCKGAGGFEALCRSAGGFRAICISSGGFVSLVASVGGWRQWMSISSQPSQVFMNHGSRYPMELSDGKRRSTSSSAGWARISGGDCDHCIIRVVKQGNDYFTGLALVSSYHGYSGKANNLMCPFQNGYMYNTLGKVARYTQKFSDGSHLIFAREADGHVTWCIDGKMERFTEPNVKADLAVVCHGGGAVFQIL